MTMPPLVLVTWHDAWFDFELEHPDEAREDYIVITVGFLVAETAKRLSVAQELLPVGDGFRAVTHIQRRLVESVTPLQELAEELRNGLESGTSSDPPPLGETPRGW